MSEHAQKLVRWMRAVEEKRLVRLKDVRPEYAESLRFKDRLGREEGHWMGGLTYATLMAEVGVGVKEVPGDFWNLSVTEDGYAAAEVACPCGETPLVEALGPPLACDGEGCGRGFFFDGDNVWAYNSPTPTANDPEESTVVPS